MRVSLDLLVVCGISMYSRVSWTYFFLWPEHRCYWWPFELKNPDGTAADCGVNTRNMDPLEIYHVNRKIERAWVFALINNKDMAHAEDQAKYWPRLLPYFSTWMRECNELFTRGTNWSVGQVRDVISLRIKLWHDSPDPTIVVEWSSIESKSCSIFGWWRLAMVSLYLRGLMCALDHNASSSAPTRDIPYSTPVLWEDYWNN